jgi:hypothetical protein
MAEHVQPDLRQSLLVFCHLLLVMVIRAGDPTRASLVQP